MMIAAGADEGGLRSELLHELKAERAAVKGQGPIEIGDLEMDVANVDSRINGGGRAHPPR